MEFHAKEQLPGLLDWMRQQMKACGGKTAVIGISGGKDSSVVGTLEYLDVLKLQFVPFLVVSLVSTPLVYAATAWSVRLLMKLFHAKEASHD